MKTPFATLLVFAACAVSAAAAEVWLSPGVKEIVKLSQSDVSAEVIKSFVAKSVLVYDLSADEIIHLRKAGVADEIVTSMLKQVGTARATSAATATANSSTPGPAASVSQTSVIYQPDPSVIAPSYYDYPTFATRSYPGYYGSSPVYYPPSQFYARFGTPLTFGWTSMRYSYPHYSSRFSIGLGFGGVGFGYGGGYYGGFRECW